MMKKIFFFAGIGGLLAGTSLAAATLVVDQNSREPDVFRTIGEAAAKAVPGDEILVHKGVYREHIAPERGGEEGKPITYRTVKPGEVFVRGSEIWNPEWTVLDGVYAAPVPPDSFFGNFPNPFKRKLNAGGRDKGEPARPTEGDLLPYSLGQIFSNGIELRQSQTVEEVYRTPGSWIIRPDGSEILVHFPVSPGFAPADPKNIQVEIAVRDRVFAPARRGLGYIHIEGFVFEHCANQAPFPQLGMVSTRSGHHWKIRNNVIRHAKTVGLDVGSEYWQTDKISRTVPADRTLLRKGGYHEIYHNRITDNGLCGIAGWSCRGTRIFGNIVERNNNLSLSTNECNWEEWGGIKLHEADETLVERNLVRFNGAHGIWFDNGYNRARITRNVLFGNVGSGIFIELGAGSVMIDNNIIANTTPYSSYYPGRGIYCHDASGINIYHNLIMDNAAEGVYMRNVTDRKYHGKIVETSHERVLNNIFYHNGGGVSFPLPGERSQDCVSDWNLFIGQVDFRYSSTPWEKAAEVAAPKLSAEELAASAALKGFTPQLWKKVSGLEEHSLFRHEREFSVRIKPFEASLYLNNRSGLKLEFESVGVDRDFDGKPYGSKVIPGPFQNLEKKTEYRILFPLWDFINQ